MSIWRSWLDVHTDVDVTRTVSTPGVKIPGRQEHALETSARTNGSRSSVEAALTALISDDAVPSAVADA